MKNYLSDVITENDIKEMLKPGLTLMVAPTGTGKSKFFTEELVKTQLKDTTHEFLKEEIGVFANRTAVKSKMIKDVDVAKKEMKLEESENVMVDSYQKLASVEMLKKIEQFKLLICDEAHYFIADAWNGITSAVLKKILELSKTKPVILFTATPELIVEYFEDHKIKPTVHNFTDVLGFYDRMNFIVTNKSLEQIVKEMNGDKWLAFEEDGKGRKKIIKRAEAFSENDFPCTGYHSQWIQRKDGVFYGETEPDMMNKIGRLVFEKKFPTQGAIANKALDNGIDILDDDLKHIVLINQFDPVQIKQMIGRKRFDINNPEDKLTVWLTTDGNAGLERTYKKLSETKKVFNDYWIYHQAQYSYKESVYYNPLNPAGIPEDKIPAAIDDSILNDFIMREYVEENDEGEEIVMTYEEKMKKLKLTKTLIQNREYGWLLTYQYKNILPLMRGIKYDDQPVIINTMGNYQELVKRLFKKSSTIQWRNKDQAYDEKQREFKRRVDEELVPYLKGHFEQYLYDDERKKFQLELSFYYGAQIKSTNSSASIGTINKFIEHLGFVIKNKQKKIEGENKKTWFLCELEK